MARLRKVLSNQNESSSITLTSLLKVSHISNPLHCGKDRGKASKVKSLTLVATGVLEKDGATSGKKVKGGSNTSSRSIEDASSITLDSRGKKNSQSS